MIDLLLKAGSFLINFFKFKSEKDDGKREIIVNLLVGMSELIEDVIFDLENDNFPEDMSDQIIYTSTELVKALKGLVDEDDLKFLDFNKKTSILILELYESRKDIEEIYKLQKASGYYKASAIMASI